MFAANVDRLRDVLFDAVAGAAGERGPGLPVHERAGRDGSGVRAAVAVSARCINRPWGEGVVHKTWAVHRSGRGGA